MRIKIASNLLFCLSFLLTNIHLADGQIHGYVNDNHGNGMPFATLHIQGTTEGASTNIKGYFELYPSSNGKIQVVCQYMGYETSVNEIAYEGRPIELNLKLTEEAITVPQVEITADGRDPAYAIIKQAMDQRKYFLDKIQSLSYDSYIKGRLDLEKVPALFLKPMMDDMDDLDVDSLGRGIVYLSESESSYYKSKKGRRKEVMHSSKVSGFDNQFSMNNAMSMDMSIYQNQFDFGANIISPISKGAFFYYKYKLLGTTFDEKGRLLNKIQVIPKSKNSPTFSGIVYVEEDAWSVPKAELILTSSHLPSGGIDSLSFIYSSVEVQDDVWVDIHRQFWMRFKLFGFAVSGGFNGVFNDFIIDPDYQEDFFDNELFKVEDGSNEKSEKYWDSIRPIPLTDKETINYVKMDSLQIKRKLRTDSLIDRPHKIRFNGTTVWYYDKGKYAMIYNLIQAQGFNTVQGFGWRTKASFRSHRDSIHRPGFRVGVQANYGISEKRLRGSASFTREINNDKQVEWTVEAGRFIEHYRERPPIYALANLVYSLIDENNYAKYIEKDAVSVQYKSELVNGISTRLFSSFERRRALINHSDYSWAKAEDEYFSNNPLDPKNDFPAFSSHSHLKIGFSSRIVFSQKFISLPKRKFKIISKYPVIEIGAAYDRNLTFDHDFVQLHLSLRDHYDWNSTGDGEWSISGGLFLLDNPILFADFKHFDGNLTRFGDPVHYQSSFHLLPYYSHSTNDKYLEVHYQHHFRGFILNKIPLIRKLKWQVAGGANLLSVPNEDVYGELNIGVENIGISVFRFLRVDAVLNFDESGHIKTDYMIGLNLNGLITDPGKESDKKIKIHF